MALSDYEKAIINGTITPEFISPKEQLPISELLKMVKDITNIIRNPKKSNSDFYTFQEIFNNPEKIIVTTDKNLTRHAELERPTIGEVREHLIHCVDLIIYEQARNRRLNTTQIGWNSKKLLELVIKIPQNDFKIMRSQELTLTNEERLEIRARLLIVVRKLHQFWELNEQKGLFIKQQIQTLNQYFESPLIRKEKIVEIRLKLSVSFLKLREYQEMRERLELQIEPVNQTLQALETRMQNNQISIEERLQMLDNILLGFRNPQNAETQSVSSNSLEERRTDSNTNNTANQQRRGLRAFFQRFRRTNNANGTRTTGNNAQADDARRNPQDEVGLASVQQTSGTTANQGNNPTSLSELVSNTSPSNNFQNAETQRGGSNSQSGRGANSSNDTVNQRRRSPSSRR